MEDLDLTNPALDFASHRVVTIPADAGAREAAQTLEREGVGSLIVVDEESSPVGILTDRDLVTRVVAHAPEPHAVKVREVMSTPLVTAEGSDPLDALLGQMARNGIRRIPLLQDDTLAGVLALDDLLQRLAMDLGDLGRIVASSTPR